MDIFDSTLKLKDYLYKGNQQLVQINGEIETSGFSLLPLLTYFGKISKIEDYDKHTHVVHRGHYLFDPDIEAVRRNFKSKQGKWKRKMFTSDELTSKCVDTKEYWNFLHKNFQYCDVCSYYRVTNLESYFDVKGKHYDSIIKSMGGFQYFKGLKILEIGPGYGYLPKILKENNIRCDYYCADIVHRFDHDNFIDVNGYTLSPIIDTFDVIIMQDVIQHLNSDIFETYTTEIKNMLVEGGKLIIGTELREKEDFVGHFFGQTYHRWGLNNIQKHLVEKLGFLFDWKYLVMNNQNIGLILEYTKMDSKIYKFD